MVNATAKRCPQSHKMTLSLSLIAQFAMFMVLPLYIKHVLLSDLDHI